MKVKDWQVRATVLGFILGLLGMAALRYLESGVATPGYVVLTILCAIILQRNGVSLNRFGFATPPRLRMLALALLGIAFLQVLDHTVYPLVEQALGVVRDLRRFDGVAGSVSALMTLLFFSWTFAALGEEVAYRVVLMRAIANVLGDSRLAVGVALVMQALIFGIAHAYQGPMGVISSSISGLVFGGLVLSCRGSIWAAFLAHGGNNTIGILLLYHA